MIVGNETNVFVGHLKDGHTRSCGCLLNYNRENGLNRKHGLCYTRIYKIWKHMIRRCYSKNHSRYDEWGGRGIKVCDEWLNNPKAFYDWSMENGYRDDLSIDRIDNNGNYEPSNCRWATPKEQSNNRRSCIIITHNGETHNLKQWSLIMNKPYSTLLNRYYKYKTIFKEEIKK